MIEKLKQQYIKDKIQFIEVSKDGVILDSDNNLFNIKKGDSIHDVHPFFESIQYHFEEKPGSEFTISCVNLELGAISGIFDLIINVQKDSIIFSMIDFTAHYQISNTLSQEKNESLIQSQILKEREEFKNKFLANTSHELRTPLNSIMGFSTILQRSNLNESQLHYLDIIKQSGEHLRNLIDDILDISKIEMGRLKIQYDRFDFFKVMELIKDTYTIKTKTKNIEFSIKIDKNIPKYIVGDKIRLTQILTNILDNAVKFTDRGNISLNVKLLERKSKNLKVEFEIEDTGIGIQEDKIGSIFESFIQTHDVNTYGGTGLGLSIVKSLINLMNGSLNVESKINKGTTFKFILNFEFSANQKDDDALEYKPKTHKEEHKFNILVADDLESNLLLLMKILADYGDYYVDIVSNGDQVIERLNQNSYDLILMDLKMPKMDGYETTRFIRQSELEEYRDIPIIALTANVSPLEKEICLRIGMNDYVAKPFNEKELIKKMNNLLAEKAS
ncbi:MAG: response regulator [Flavobacteriaceae bacterium]|nr:response regulator [Flavobacteriaceae bacterium]